MKLKGHCYKGILVCTSLIILIKLVLAVAPRITVNAGVILKSFAILAMLGKPCAFDVSMEVEVEEEEQEHHSIEPNDVQEDGELVGTVLHEEDLANVDGHHHKLDLGKGTTYLS